MIIDFRDCFLDSNPVEFVKLVNYIASNFKDKGNRKVAYLTSKPNEVVLTALYLHQHEHKINGFKVSGFQPLNRPSYGLETIFLASMK